MSDSESLQEARVLADGNAGTARSFKTPALSRSRSGADLPEAFAPLIRNAWYVIAESSEVGQDLRAVTVLGDPLVYYRTEAGEPVVLDDRCAHRRFSLSRSKRIGDAIQCGYHGFTYDKTGECIWAPTLKGTPGMGVRRYPCAEVGPWLWVWTGEPGQADPADIPYPKLEPRIDWLRIEGYKFNPGNYMLLIENFLDLTHLHYLHGVAGSQREAEARLHSFDPPGAAVGWYKELDSAPMGPLAALFGGAPEQHVRMRSTVAQYGPSLNYGTEDRYALPGEEGGLYPFHFHIIHAITPQDESGTHQFFQQCLSIAPVDGLEKFRDYVRDVVYEQDVEAIGIMQQYIMRDTREGSVEFGTSGDRFGIKMRRYLRQLKARELDDEPSPF